MKKLFSIWLLLVSIPVLLLAQEAITLNTPIVPVTISNYSPAALNISINPPRIVVQLVATDGHFELFNYPCAVPCAFTTDAQVTTLIGNLNTANLATRSLWRRVFDRLVIDFPSRFNGGGVVN